MAVRALALLACVEAALGCTHDPAANLGSYESAVVDHYLLRESDWLSSKQQTIVTWEGQSIRIRVRAARLPRRHRLMAVGLPPGARWDEVKRELVFTPSFIQGGQRPWTLRFYVLDAPQAPVGSLRILVEDTVAPPFPRIVSSLPRPTHTLHEIEQKTDRFLDSPGFAGRSFLARVSVPASATPDNRLPVRIVLHGVGDLPSTHGSPNEFRIYPHDDFSTYWYGYSDQLPDSDPIAGTVPDYTVRRVLHLLEWVLRAFPGADRERVYVTGGSMGGAGAMYIGLRHARHFALADGPFGQTVARFHRFGRLERLQEMWGETLQNLPTSDNVGVWDRFDLTAMLDTRPDANKALQVPEARRAYVMSRYGKDDRAVYFSALVGRSPLTHLSFSEVLQQEGIGHSITWDERGHLGTVDPVLGAAWWETDWNPMHSDTTYLRRDLAFPAFTQSNADEDPGIHDAVLDSWEGPGRYLSGDPEVAGDTSWNGDIAGAINRWLRWDSNRIVDEFLHFAMPLRVDVPELGHVGIAGYPKTKRALAGEDHGQETRRKGTEDPGKTRPPTAAETALQETNEDGEADSEHSRTIVTNVTIRRTQRFSCVRGERIRWRFGKGQGEVLANRDGSVTVPKLPIDGAWRTLELERMQLFRGHPGSKLSDTNESHAK